MRLLGDEAFAAPTGTQFDAFPGPIPTRIVPGAAPVRGNLRLVT